MYMGPRCPPVRLVPAAEADLLLDEPRRVDAGDPRDAACVYLSLSLYIYIYREREGEICII